MSDFNSLLVFLFIGLIAGWLAGVLFKGSGFGILGDIVVGVIGAEIGGWIFSKMGWSTYGFAGAVFMAFVGAVALLVVIKLVRNIGSARALPVVLLLLACSWPAHATTTVTVDSNDKVVVSQPNVVVVPTPAVITREAIAGDFEGRIVGVDYSRNQVLVREDNNHESQLVVTPDVINNYRVGDYVIVHPTTNTTVLTMQENPKDFEGDIIRVDMSAGQIVVLDTNGRERKVQLKRGMIGTYKVDDYIRVHLMADLKEAKTIETIGDVRDIQGSIVNVDTSRSQIVVRDEQGKDSTVWVRQGLINNYSIGQHVRLYILPNHEEAQLIRVVR